MTYKSHHQNLNLEYKSWKIDQMFINNDCRDDKIRERAIRSLPLNTERNFLQMPGRQLQTGGHLCGRQPTSLQILPECGRPTFITGLLKPASRGHPGFLHRFPAKETDRGPFREGPHSNQECNWIAQAASARGHAAVRRPVVSGNGQAAAGGETGCGWGAIPRGVWENEG